MSKHNSNSQKVSSVPILLFGVVFLFFNITVQAQDLIWAKRAGGASHDSGADIVVDASGNSYITGHFDESALFGVGEVNETTLHSAGSIDIFVAQYDANGLLLWATQAGGSDVDQGYGIAVDGSGNSYIIGMFEGVATFGTDEANETIVTSVGLRDIFIARYNTDGMLLWAKRAGGGSFDFGDCIELDASGNSYVTGAFEGSATFGAGEANETTLTSAGDRDIFVAKYDTDGLLVWVKPAGGSEGDKGSGIAVDASSNSYVTGEFEGSATFGAGEANQTTLTSAGVIDIFVAKYDAGGVLLWAKRDGGSDVDRGSGIVVDASGSSM